MTLITGVNTGVVTLSADSKQLRFQSGAYIIHCAWTTSDDGAFSMALMLNGVKIPFMNYIVEFANDSLKSVIPGYVIIYPKTGDILSITNYGPKSTLAVPINNISKGSTANSAATITLFKLSNFRVSNI